jgi:hypothetical protein
MLVIFVIGSDMTGEAVITIGVSEYMVLLKDQSFLNCLKNAGVDNWDGYEYALELLEEDEDD